VGEQCLTKTYPLFGNENLLAALSNVIHFRDPCYCGFLLRERDSKELSSQEHMMPSVAPEAATRRSIGISKTGQTGQTTSPKLPHGAVCGGVDPSLAVFVFGTILHLRGHGSNGTYRQAGRTG
jgi:hypothetical protein